MGKKNGDGGGLFAAYLAAMPENPSTAETQTGAIFLMLMSSFCAHIL